MDEFREDNPQIDDEDLDDLSADDIEVVGLDDEEEEDEEAMRTPTEEELDEIIKEAGETPSVATGLANELQEAKDKYVRLYAEFENYRKLAAKSKDEVRKYANESIIFDLLPSLDTLDIALKHVNESSDQGLVEGVRNTLRELMRTLEKYGLKPIEAEGKPFDPEYHHAVSQVERDDMDEQMVVEDMRRGYMYGDKVLRASMVSVSVKPSGSSEEETTE